jgi:DNA-binding NarL/FixJ family response regulator
MSSKRMAARTKRILIAEPTPSTRQAIESILSSAGYEVVAGAADGGQTIELHVTHHPDLLLMQTGLPGMDGFAAAKLVRAFDPQVAIVLYGRSGSDDPEHTECRAIAAGANLFIRDATAPESLLSGIGGLTRMRTDDRGNA